MNLEKINIKEHFSMEEWDTRAVAREKLYKNMAKIMHETKKPFMQDCEIEAFEKVLLGLNEKYLDILEWGSGYSTVYFSEFLVDNDIDYKWDSLEIDVRWYIEIVKLGLEYTKIDIHLFDEEILRIDDRRCLRRFQMNEYVKFPSRLEKKFDLIFIDGSKRVRCLKEATKLLNPDGVVLLHDAQRPEYKEGMDLYDGKILAGTLWLGKLKKSQ